MTETSSTLTTEMKLDFLMNKFPSHLDNLDPNTKGQWGKMSVQQMIEHMTDSIREANGKEKRAIVTPEDKLPLFKNFLMTEKEFRPETKNPIMPEEPAKTSKANKEEAIKALRLELNDFVNHFKNNPDSQNASPVFGFLNFDEWIQMLNKHARHHLKQFGAI